MASQSTDTCFTLLSLGDLVIEMTIPVVLVVIFWQICLKTLAWVFAQKMAAMPSDKQERALEAFHAFQINPNGKERRCRKKKDL